MSIGEKQQEALEKIGQIESIDNDPKGALLSHIEQTDQNFAHLSEQISKVEKMQGPQGEKGEKGDTGPQGPEGPVGKPGDKGEKGEPGKDGKNGADGQDGKDGIDGVDGVDGRDGNIGPMPKHRWKGSEISFELSPGKFGDSVDLRGPQGFTGPAGLGGGGGSTKIQVRNDGQLFADAPQTLNFKGFTMSKSGTAVNIESSGGGGTPGGTNGQVQYNNSGAFGGFGNYDSGDDIFSMSGANSQIVLGDTDGSIDVDAVTINPRFLSKSEGSDVDAMVNMQFSNFAALGGIIGSMRARGTIASPLVIQADDIIGSAFFAGYNGSKFLSAGGFKVTCASTPTGADTDMQTKIAFQCRKAGASDVEDVWEIDEKLRFRTLNGVKRNMTLVNAATYTADVEDHLIIIYYTNTGTHTLTLPAISSDNDGQEFEIKDGDTNAGTNNITINTTGADTIDNASSFTISTSGQSIRVVADNTNTNWVIL